MIYKIEKHKIEFVGGGTSELAARDIAELEKNYPDHNKVDTLFVIIFLSL